MKKLIQKFNNKLFNSKKINIKDTILVAGSPRSGTTWLMQILCEIPGYTYIFEPLNPIWSPDSYEVGFRSRTYLNDITKWSEGEEYLKKVFTGQLAYLPIKNNQFYNLFYNFSIKELANNLFASKIIVKSVNMTRMVPWIAKIFQLRSIIFIIRHPCATITSQLKSGFCGYRNSSPPFSDIYPTKKIILNEIKDIVELNSNQIKKLKKIEKIEEILAATWCLDNLITLSKEKPSSWKFISYENLVKKSDKEIFNIFTFIGEKNIPATVFYRLKKPSSVTLKEDKKHIKTPEKQLTKWKEYLSKEQIIKINKIVSYFNLDLYNEEDEPNY